MSKRKTTMEQLAEGVGLPSMEMLVADHEEIESLRKRLAELEAENQRFRKGKHFVEKRKLEGLLRETVPWLEDAVELEGGNEPQILIDIKAALREDENE